MKKPRATKPPPLPVLPPEYHDLARDKLLEDCLAFIAGTNVEDPKLYAARLAAAVAAFELLTRLRDAAAAAQIDVAPTKEEVIDCARVQMIDENKS
jgi:hypothetical protein